MLCRHTRSAAFFFFNDTATTEIYTLSLHDALPIFLDGGDVEIRRHDAVRLHGGGNHGDRVLALGHGGVWKGCGIGDRSEEHTSELQSHLNLVCRLLLEKKKNRPP